MNRVDSPSEGRRRVLLIYRLMIPTVRLCGHCQLEDLAARGMVEYRAVQELALRASDIRWAELVVLGRLDSWYELHVVKLARQAGKTLLYIIDDDLLNIPPEVSSAAYYAQREIQGNIRAMIGMSDAILSPSPRLLEQYAGDCQAGILIEEPALNPVPYAPHEPGAPLKIGFAGSIDRGADLEVLLRDALLEIKAAYGSRVAFEFFGVVPPFAQALDARCLPYRESYDAYRLALNEARWDIGLAPMPDTPFHACKHYNKFCEYAAAGIAGVYSDVYPYTRIRAFGDCALLCENTPEAWTAALRRLVEDDTLRQSLRRAACACAQGPLSVTCAADALWRALSALPLRVGVEAPRFGLRLFVYKLVNLFKRIQSKLRGEGLPGLLRAGVNRLRGLRG